MNKRFLWISAVALTALALSFNAFAQPGGQRGQGGPGQRGQGGPGGPGQRGQGGTGGPGGMAMAMPGGGMMIGMLLRNEEVPKMLELTAEQREALQKIFDDARAQRPQGTPGTPPNLDDMRRRTDEIQAKVNQVLKPNQQEKVKELTFQLSGGLDSRFLDERALEVLQLTAEQKDKIRKISEERVEAGRNAMQGVDFRNMSQEDRDKFRTDMEARAKKYGDQVKDVLTAEQKEKAEKLTAGAAEVREKLGIGQGGATDRGSSRRNDRSGQGGPRDNYVPGADSWRPGQGTPQSTPNPNGGSRFRNNTRNNAGNAN